MQLPQPQVPSQRPEAHLLLATRRSSYPIEVRHIDRSLNYAADRLADEAICLSALLRKYSGNRTVQIDYPPPVRRLPVLDVAKYDEEKHLHIRQLVSATYDYDVFIKRGEEQELLHALLLAALRTD